MNDLKLTDEILLSVPQAAKIMHTSVNTVRKLHRAGLIKFLKLGELKVRRDEIDRFLKEYEGMDLSDPFNPKELTV